MRLVTHRSTRRAGGQRGFTLVELAVAVAIAVILLSVAAPSFSLALARLRVEGASQNLATDLQLARQEAVQRRANVSLTTAADGGSYTLTSGTVTIKTVTLSSGVAFTPDVVVTFEPLRGLANAAEIVGTASGTSSRLRLNTDVMGRVQICSPGGSFKAYTSC